jgi:alpha-amylase/alpha-mannosidase (GH57 family)
MKKLKFLFAVHCHQPLGNFPEIYRLAFEQAYWPFLKTVSRYSRFKFALHFSGFLWEYLEKQAPEALELIKKMVDSGQVELLGGGFYEPILTQIPERDRLAQVQLMNDFLERHFQIKPAGLWSAERVWEPHLASFLQRAGFSYTLLDEEHFHYAGVKNIHGYYLTEDEGLTFRIFPIDKSLRYLIPFRSFPELKEYFQKILNSGNDTAIIGDDGEKFGLWPGTKKWVYEEGWLEKFLHFLVENGIEMLSFSEYLARRPGLGRTYLPPASYEEMMEWVLPPAEQKVFIQLKSSLPAETRRFLRGGQFRDFSIKYSESHHLRCRQLQVSAEVSQSENSEARQELYQAQCNDAYWHGVFGGLYLPHLRRAVYQKLISAELKLPFISGWEKFDFDLDGEEEWLLKTPAFFVWVKPSAGGAITEIDYRHQGINITDVLTRRQEFYHLNSTSGQNGNQGKSIHEIARVWPSDTQQWLSFDNYQRLSFLERFLPSGISRENYGQIYYQQPGNFIGKQFTARNEEDTLVLERQAEAESGSGNHLLKLRKRIRPGQDSLLFVYEIENLEKNDIELTFTSEWNFAFVENEYAVLKDRVEFFNGQLILEVPEAQAIWDWAVRTVSRSEKDFEIITQGISFHPVWRWQLAPGEKRVILTMLNQRGK